MKPRIYLSAPHVLSPNERKYLLDAFDSNWIAPLGPQVDAFETEFAAKVGKRHAVALSSGTAAIHLGLKLLGVTDGDEVFCSSLTFAASANPVCYLNARPVFIDSEKETWNMDPNRLDEEFRRRARNGKLPKAIIVVDLYGQCADYESILDLCRYYSIPVLEDAAEALGSFYQDRPAGCFGEVAAFSFNGNKIITTGGGGMLVTDNGDWAAKARFWATQSRDPAPYYQHSQIGYNYRLSNLSAALGRGQLETLDERVKRRRSHFEYYRRNLGDVPGIEFMPEPPRFFSNRWLSCLTIDADRAGTNREAIRLALENVNIESRPVWKPMHLQPVFSKCPMIGGEVSETLFENGLCLPSGSGLKDEELERVVSAIHTVTEKTRTYRRFKKAG